MGPEDLLIGSKQKGTMLKAYISKMTALKVFERKVLGEDSAETAEFVDLGCCYQRDEEEEN